MDTFLELIAALANDLNIPSTGNTQYPLDTLKLAINRAYRRATGLYRWPELEDAKKTSTAATFEYYDYPTNWRPDSVWKLEVDGKDYKDPLKFKDYLQGKLDNPNSTNKMWANQWRRYFIFPVPTATGSNNICIWGQKVEAELSADADETIFSQSLPECNDAVVLEAAAILQKKGEKDNTSQLSSAQAKGILAVAFNKILQEKMKYESTQPFLDVDDMFGNTNPASTIANFDL